NSRVSRSGTRRLTSKPSFRIPATTCGGTAGSGSVPAETARNGSRRSVARVLKYSAAIRLFAEAGRHTKNTRDGAFILALLFHVDPGGLQDREGDQADRGGGRDQDGRAQLLGREQRAEVREA